MSATHDTLEGRMADVAQVLLALLLVYPTEESILIPRTWLAAWYQDILAVLEQLRRAP